MTLNKGPWSGLTGAKASLALRMRQRLWAKILGQAQEGYERKNWAFIDPLVEMLQPVRATGWKNSEEHH